MNSAGLVSLVAALPAAMACLGYDRDLRTATSTKTLSSPQYIGAREVSNVGWVEYDREVSCTGQSEGGEAGTVVIHEEGATPRYVIIGADQGEAVYDLRFCNLEIGDGTANISGGRAYGAEYNIIQHNGCVHVNIVNFYANDNRNARSVHMEGTTAMNGGELIGINTNMGDTAIYSNNWYPMAQWQAYEGCDKSNGDRELVKLRTCSMASDNYETSLFWEQ
ncbi:family 3 polysaccharide lyase [Thozetella sp. PMI_491]|nr:family 3 polysaccharide lyase [Thozetella sp. PMI_491]